jgi:hypothetical protein
MDSRSTLLSLQRSDPFFEEELAAQKAKLDIFKDALTTRNNLEECKKDLELRKRLIEENPAKIAKLEIEFQEVSRDYYDAKTKFKTYLQLWKSQSLQPGDVALMLHEEWEALSSQKLERMSTAAKLNSLLIEEQYQLKHLPPIREKLKNDLDTLTNTLAEAKGAVPVLEVRALELEWACTVAERNWAQKWKEAKGPPSITQEGALIEKYEQKIREQHSRIKGLEQQVHLLISTDEWADNLLNGPPVLEKEEKELSLVSKTKALVTKNRSEEKNTQPGKQPLQKPETSSVQNTAGTNPPKGDSHKPGNTQLDSSQGARKKGLATRTFQHGSAMKDCEYIISSQHTWSEEDKIKKKDYFRYTYGINVDMAWKVFAKSGASMRYCDVLDWHSSVRTILKGGIFEASTYKKNFDKLFKKELSLWTLGWISDDWVPAEAFKSFLESHEDTGIPLYRWLEADFESTYAQWLAGEKQVR